MKLIKSVLTSLVRGFDNEAFLAGARPHDPVDYQRPTLDGSGSAANDIPLDGTKDGASLSRWAPRTLDGCREPLAPGVPDMRGVWEVYEGAMLGHVERIEQAGNRITITTGGLVHDMFADGTLENGVNDTSGIDGPHIRVAATFEDGVHKLRPFNKRIVAVTRKLDGDELVWRYATTRNRFIVLTGTGSPLPDGNRAGPSTLVKAGDTHVLVDAGRGTVMRMAGGGSLPAFLAAVLITHLHSDHVCALNDVITTHWVMTQGNTPLQVYGPVGTAQFIERQIHALEPDIGYRIAHHDVLTSGPQVEVTELEPGDSFTVNDISVTTAATVHAPVEPTIGYRLEHEGSTARRPPPVLAPNGW